MKCSITMQYARTNPKYYQEIKQFSSIQVSRFHFRFRKQLNQSLYEKRGKDKSIEVVIPFWRETCLIEKEREEEREQQRQQRRTWQKTGRVGSEENRPSRERKGKTQNRVLVRENNWWIRGRYFARSRLPFSSCHVDYLNILQLIFTISLIYSLHIPF